MTATVRAGELAGFWLRVGGWFIDRILFVILFQFFVFVVGLVTGVPGGHIAVVALSYSDWAIRAFCHGRWGATPGKLAVGTRVMRADSGTAIGYRRALVREAPAIVSRALFLAGWVAMAIRLGPDFAEVEIQEVFWLLQLMGLVAWAAAAWFLADSLTMIRSVRKQSIHDLLAGSIVVRDEGVRFAPERGTLPNAEIPRVPHRRQSPGF